MCARTVGKKGHPRPLAVIPALSAAVKGGSTNGGSTVEEPAVETQVCADTRTAEHRARRYAGLGSVRVHVAGQTKGRVRGREKLGFASAPPTPARSFALGAHHPTSGGARQRLARRNQSGR